MYVSGPTYWIGELRREVGRVSSGRADAFDSLSARSLGVKFDSFEPGVAASCPEANRSAANATKRLATIEFAASDQHRVKHRRKILGEFMGSIGTGSMIQTAATNGQIAAGIKMRRRGAKFA
jgi:hypothetical protein